MVLTWNRKCSAGRREGSAGGRQGWAPRPPRPPPPAQPPLTGASRPGEKLRHWDSHPGHCRHLSTAATATTTLSLLCGQAPIRPPPSWLHFPSEGQDRHSRPGENCPQPPPQPPWKCRVRLQSGEGCAGAALPTHLLLLPLQKGRGRGRAGEQAAQGSRHPQDQGLHLAGRQAGSLRSSRAGPSGCTSGRWREGSGGSGRALGPDSSKESPDKATGAGSPKEATLLS